ncbi:hypothetical protein KVG29_03030 [Caldicoprobacter algeriensis]|uniref:uroporphyrinogen decarboxylase family protein n=1 Tax=Caldicoprobacter algeriensis TaxID=699281 RepID=UPI00207941C7|nr:uroporphyrinogen decarboxylase family protein [Caldicoprobacter algeriensis]MCM8900198.1 hypothetical protein [Caldicoprobacter algeriensis]
MGIDFSEKWHLDPEYRYETLVIMKGYLHKIFPMVPYFTPLYEDGIERSCATISGVHGAVFIPLVYGLEVTYSKDDWPWVRADKHLTKEQIENLKPFDLYSNPVVVQLLEQMDIIEKKWGMIHGYINYQGILNNAFRIRGSEIFLDMYDDPDFVHFFFNHIAQTILNVSKLIQERQRKSGFYINLMSLSNCVMNMISPEQYQKFVLPYDMMLSKEYERFGIHTCNWDITPYINVLRKIDKMGYIDMGMVSDMKRVKEVFPDARRAVMYSPVELEKKTADEIRLDIQRIYDELAPCDIVMADIQDTTPDSKVIEFLNIVDDVQGKY